VRPARRRCSISKSPLSEEKHLSRIQQVIDTLEAKRAEVQNHLAWLDQQIKEFHAYDGGSAAAAPARSVRRATARRASNRRATARSRQATPRRASSTSSPSTPGRIAGDLANGLNLNPGSVSTRLNQLANGRRSKGHHAATARIRRRDSARTSPHSATHSEPALDSTEAPNRAKLTAHRSCWCLDRRRERAKTACVSGP
jgi:hypothetical protein